MSSAHHITEFIICVLPSHGLSPSGALLRTTRPSAGRACGALRRRRRRCGLWNQTHDVAARKVRRAGLDAFCRRSRRPCSSRGCLHSAFVDGAVPSRGHWDGYNSARWLWCRLRDEICRGFLLDIWDCRGLGCFCDACCILHTRRLWSTSQPCGHCRISFNRLISRSGRAGLYAPASRSVQSLCVLFALLAHAHKRKHLTSTRCCPRVRQT